jgi:trehalose 6-phosphate phosphatase
VSPLFSPEGLRELEALLQERPLVLLDFDGTLAPIVEDPREARMRDRTSALLRRAAGIHPCAVVSGRARADVLGRLDGAPVVAAIGNHGMELDETRPGPALRARVRAWAAVLHAPLLEEDDRIELEDKGFTLSIHYRHARSPGATRSRILALASALPAVRIVGGHAVVNVLPKEGASKGDAVTMLAGRFPRRPVLYVGDDDTDEDAFGSPAVTLAVRVGYAPESSARFFLEGQHRVDDLLVLIERVPPRPGQPRLSTGDPE